MGLLSVIVPSYNEEDNIALAARTVAQILHDAEIPYEILFVDDGSRDKTYARICEESRENPKVRGLSFSRNFGKEASIFAGLREARGDCCVILDCDLQFPPKVIPDMYRLWEQGYEVVEGIKASRGKESLLHKCSAGAFYKLISRCTHVDMQSSSDFKLLDRKVVDVLVALPEKDTFFRALSFWVGVKTASVEFEVEQRRFGQSKWSFKGLVNYAVQNITSFTTVPLQAVTFIGTVLLISSVVLGIQTLVKFLMGRAGEGFTTVILLLLIIGGAIMISLGIIGHYIARIYDEVKRRPKYIVARRTDEGVEEKPR